MAGGVLPVIKHIPGHGRATTDSHLDLPVVTAARAELEASDFAPFRALADMPAAMTAHVVFTAIDADAPASTSARVTAEIIRGAIGFDGLLMSDDLGMRALTGNDRASGRKPCSRRGRTWRCCAAATWPRPRAWPAPSRSCRARRRPDSLDACAVFRQQTQPLTWPRQRLASARFCAASPKSV